MAYLNQIINNGLLFQLAAELLTAHLENVESSETAEEAATAPDSSDTEASTVTEQQNVSGGHPAINSHQKSASSTSTQIGCCVVTPEMRSVGTMCCLLTASMTESSESIEEDLAAAAAADSNYACPDSESTSHDDSSSESDDHIDQYTETEESVTKASAYGQASAQIPVMFMAMHSKTLRILWQMERLFVLHLQHTMAEFCCTVQVDVIST